MPHERLGIFDRIKAFFGVVGCIGMGVFMLVPPGQVLEEMREEITDPWRIRIGIGFLAFGALFGITAIASCSSSPTAQAVAARGKGGLLAAVCALILTGILFSFGKDVYHAFRLQERGVPATAEVTRRYVSRAKNTTTYSYGIRYADRHHARLVLPDNPRVGHRFSVLYLEADPTVVLPGKPGEGMLVILERKCGLWPAIGYTAVAVACVLGVVFGLIRFIAGKRPEIIELTD